MSAHGVLDILYSPYEAAGLIIMAIALAAHAIVDFAKAKRNRDSKEN